MPNKQIMQYGISAPTVITPGSPLNPITGFVGFIQQAQGSAGVFTFNDCATLAGASEENQILTIIFSNAYQVEYPLDLPISTGLVVSAVPTGAVLSVTYTEFVAG